jgi:hypothetical protein
MSHVVTIQTRVHDPAAVAAACQRMNLPEAVQGAVRIYQSEAAGLIVQLPDWEYPLAIDTQSGTIRYDNFGGHWGAQEHLDRFLQAYALEKVKLEARKKGYAVSEQALQDGSVRVQIVEGA